MTLDEYKEYRKKKKEEAGVSEDTENVQQKNTSSVSSSIYSLINGFESDRNALYNEYKNRYANGNSQYRGDTQDWLNRVYDTNAKFTENYKKINDLLDQYGDTLDFDFERGVRSYIGQDLKNFTSMLRQARDEDKFFSQYESEDAFNDARKSYEDYMALLDFDTESAQAEVDELQALYDKASASLNVPSYTYENGPRGQSMRQRTPEELTEAINAGHAEARAILEGSGYDTVDQLNEALNSKREYLYQAKQAQKVDNFEKEAKADDAFTYYEYQGANSSKNAVKKAEKEARQLEKYNGSFIDPVSVQRGNLVDTVPYMTDKEKSLYNYLLGKELSGNAEKGTSNDYLEAIGDTLNQRLGSEYFSKMENNIALELIFGVQAGLSQFSSGMGGVVASVFDPSKEHFNTAPAQYTSSLVREDLSGSKVAQGAYDAISTTANMFPSIATYYLLAKYVPSLAPAAGAALLGTSAAGNAYTEMVNAGYTADQARAYATMTGISEAGLEYVLGGIYALGGKLSGNAIKGMIEGITSAGWKAAIKFGAEMASEGVEEFLQDVLDPYFKALATGSINVEDVDWEQATYSGILGALSAGLLNGASIGANFGKSVSNAAQIAREGNASSVLDYANTFAADTLSEKLLAKLGDNPSVFDLARAIYKLDGRLTEQNQADIKNELMKKGYDEQSAEDTAAWLALVSQGYKLNGTQQKALALSPTLQSVFTDVIINKNSTVNERLAAREKAYTGKESSVGYNLPTEEKKAVKPDLTRATKRVESAQAISRELRKGEPAVETIKLQQPSTNSVTRIIESAKENAEFNPSSVSETAQDVAREFSKAMGYDEELTKQVSELAVGINDESRLDDFLRGVSEGINYGVVGQKFDTIRNNGFYNDLESEAKQLVYRYGREYAKRQDKTRAEKVASKQTEGVRREGKVTYLAEPETERQKASAKMVGEIATKITNNEVVFYASKEGEVNGKKTRVLAEELGGRKAGDVAPNGFYDPQTGKIYIDLNAGNNGEGVILWTFAHELTHFIRDWSPAKFRTLADFLVEEYGKAGKDLEELIADQMASAKANGRSISYDTAFEEVVADAMSSMLTDTEAYEKMMLLKEKDQTLWAKLKAKIQEIIKAIREWYDNLSPQNRAQAATMSLDPEKVISKLSSLFAEGVVEAGNIYGIVEGVDPEIIEGLNEQGIGIDPESEAAVLQSIRTAPSTEEEIKLAVNRLVDSGLGFTEDQANEWVRSLTSVSSLILDDLAHLDYENDARYSWLKKNSDYPQGSVDFNNNCPKRSQFTAIFDRLQQEFPNRVFTAEDYEKIRQELIKEDVTVSCGPCFVEDRRQHLGEIAQQFIDALNDGSLKPKFVKMVGSDTYVPTQYDLVTYDGAKKLYENHPGVYNAFIAFNNARGMAAARLLEGMAEYDNQIKSWNKNAIKAKNNRGGLRIFSLSDGDPRIMIDIIQIVLDSAEKGLMIQGYTKKNWFAKMVRETGMRILRSNIPAGNGIRTLADGTKVLAYDNVEGINRRDKNWFDATNERNIGDNIIGINDDMIRLAMVTQDIDQIIPFHTGIKTEILKRKGISHWYNYKNEQTEKAWTYNEEEGKWEIKKSKYQVNIYTDILNAWAEKGTPIKNRDEFMQAYLQVCDEHHVLPRFARFLAEGTIAKNENGEIVFNKDENGRYVDTLGFEKFLVDYKMFDRTTGEIMPQEAVKPIFDDEYNMSVLRDYSKGVSDIKLLKPDTYEKVKALFSDRVQQDITSADTSINQIPALFRDKNVKFGKTNIDIGGGKFDTASNYLSEQGTKNYIFDPFNRSAESNRQTLNVVKSGGADTVTCANVLNVIREAEARENVILEAAKSLKDGGTAYFSVYEGDGTGIGKETSKGWQNNKKTSAYVAEIEEFFNNVDKKGKVIVATDPKANLPQASWELSAGGDVVKYSLRGKNADGIEVYETNDDIRELPWNKRVAEYERMLTQEFYGRTARFVRNGHTYYARFDTDNVRKIPYGEKGMSRAGREAIVNAGANGDIFDVVENSTYKSSEADTKNHKKTDGFTDYFDYFYKTVQIDGKVFDILVNVKKKYGTEDGLTYTIKVRDNKKMKASPAKVDAQPSWGQEMPSVRNDTTSPSSRQGVDQTSSENFKKWFGSSKVVNEDGSPMVVYHGTDADFTVFDRTKGRSTMDIQGMFFSPYELDAKGYGNKVGAYYLSIKNPASESLAYKALRLYQGENNAGVKARNYLERKGYDGVINEDKTEFIAFKPEQIKSATNNVGTFDSANPDVRYSDRDFKRYGHRMLYKEETVDRLLNSYAIEDSPNTSQAWVAWVNPSDFVPATTTISGLNYVRSEQTPLDVEKMQSEKQPIFLDVDLNEEGTPERISGHEGRHRSMAIAAEGISRYPVILFDYGHWQRDRAAYSNLFLFGQKWQGEYGKGMFVSDVTPLDFAHKDEIVEKFATQTANEKLANKYGTFDTLRYSDRGNRPYAPTFYSKLEQEIENMKLDKVSAQSVVPFLKNRGVKDEEIKWSGIEAFLDGKKSVTKAELLEVAQANRLQIREVVLDHDTDNNDPIKIKDALEVEAFEFAEQQGIKLYEEADLVIEKIGNRYVAFAEYDDDGHRVELASYNLDQRATRWKKYALDGMTDYREYIFQNPMSTYTNQMMDAHWRNEGIGVLVHARADTGVTEDAESVFFVEEVQSDWHNAGRKGGYVNGIVPSMSDVGTLAMDSLVPWRKARDIVQKTGKSQYEAGQVLERLSKDRDTSLNHRILYREGLLKEDRDEVIYFLKEADEIDKKMREAIENSKKAPEAPFKDTYQDFAMKNMLRLAAEEGFSYIGWTTAEQQDVRWDDHKYHTPEEGKSGNLKGFTIEYDQQIPKFMNKFGKQFGESVIKKRLDNGEDVWAMKINEEMKKSVLYVGQPLYSERSGMEIDNRTLLSNALATTAQNDVERKLITDYQSQIEKMSAEQRKLEEMRAKMRELSFSKGKRDAKAIAKLRDEITKTANRINIYDKKLLRLESAEALRNVIEREKVKATKAAAQRGRAALAEYRADRRKTDIRNRIKKLRQDFQDRLLRSTDTKYVPRDLVQGIIDVATMIDPTGRNQDTKVAEKFRSAKSALAELKMQYDALGNSDSYDFSSEFNEEFSQKIADLAEAVGNKPLRDMDANELEDVYNIMRDIRFMLTTATQQIGLEERISNYEAGTEVIENMKEVVDKGLVTGKVADFFREWTLNPLRAVREMSGFKDDARLVKLFDQIDEGLVKANKFRMEATKQFDDMRNTKEGRKAFNEAVEKPFDFGLKDIKGNPLKISKMQAMQLLLTMERESANPGRRHLEGGVKIPDVELQAKGKRQEAFDKGQVFIPLGDKTYIDIYDKLSDWDKEYLKRARTFFNEQAKQAVNETSLISKGRIIASEKAYIPYEVNQDYIKKESENVKFNASLENKGILKSVKPGARQMIVMRGLNGIVDKHINDVADIYGLTVPVRNFNKVFNVIQTDVDGGESVKSAIRDAWGEGGLNLVDQAVADVQTRRRGEKNPLVSAVKSAFVGSTLAGNISVTLKQAASYPTAFAYLTPWAFAQGWADIRRNGLKKTFDEIDAHTPMHWIRRQGLSMQELGEMKQSGGWQNKLNDFLGVASPMKWIQGMDVLTTAAIWYAAKRDVQLKGISPESENYWDEVTKTYNKVIEDTQPMYDPLHRAEITKNTALSNIILFQTQPIQNSGILREATLNYRAKVKEFGANSEEAKTAGKQFVKAVGSQAASHFVFTAFTLLAAAVLHKMNPYRDDDKKLTPESIGTAFAEQFGKNFFQAVVPVFGSYAAALAEKVIGSSRYDVLSDAVVDKINGTIDSFAKLKNPTAENFDAFFAELLSYLGVPAGNLRNLKKSVELFLEDIRNGEFGSFEAGVERTSGQNRNLLYESLVSGDEASADKFKDALGEDKWESALKQEVKERFLAGEADAETAKKQLEDYVGESEQDAYWDIKSWEGGADYHKYDDFYTAVETGKNLKSVIKEYTDNGVATTTLRTQITSHFKPIYVQMSTAEKASLKGYLLNALELLGYDREKASKDIDKWS